MIKIQRRLAPLLTTTLVLAGLTANARLEEEAASHVEMTPVQIPRWGDTATRNKRIQMYGLSSSISAIVSIENYKCTYATPLLQSFADDAEDVLKNFWLSEDCKPSNDGMASKSGDGIFWAQAFLRDASLNELGAELPGVSKFRSGRKTHAKMLDLAGKLAAFENRFTLEELEEITSLCEGPCPSSLSIGTDLARANYFDSVERSLTADILLLEGLQLALSTKLFLREYGATLSKHLKQAYLAAVDASDYVLAAWVIQQWEDNLWTVDKTVLVELKEHHSSWEQTFSNQAAPVGYTTPLVTDTFLSDYHSVAVRGVNSREFKINIVRGKVEYAFLNCGQLFGKQWQVHLQGGLHSGLENACRLGALQSGPVWDKGTRVKIWEYPDGNLDENGNLST